VTATQLREFDFARDYEAAVQLWGSVGPGVHVGPSDTPDEIMKKLRRDPDLFLVSEEHGRLVGTVMGGFDGRRGFVYHLAVAASHRRRGIAAQLMSEVETRLRQKGCLKCFLVVQEGNQAAADYYQSIGWARLPDALFFKEFA